MIISIPHTGTRFLKKFFKDAGHEAANYHIRMNIPNKQVLAYKREHPIIIPLRDPAMNMLSFWHRGHMNQGAMNSLAQDWRFVAENMTGSTFVPLDADHDTYERAELLKQAAETEGVPMDWEYRYKVAEEWPKVGTAGLCTEKEAYLDGDMEALADLAAPLVRALNTIKDIAPWFGQHGYKRFAWQ